MVIYIKEENIQIVEKIKNNIISEFIENVEKEEYEKYLSLYMVDIRKCIKSNWTFNELEITDKYILDISYWGIYTVSKYLKKEEIILFISHFVMEFAFDDMAVRIDIGEEIKNKKLKIIYDLYSKYDGFDIFFSWYKIWMEFVIQENILIKDITNIEVYMEIRKKTIGMNVTYYLGLLLENNKNRMITEINKNWNQINIISELTIIINDIFSFKKEIRTDDKNNMFIIDFSISIIKYNNIIYLLNSFLENDKNDNDMKLLLKGTILYHLVVNRYK